MNPALKENCLNQLVATYLLPLSVTSGSVSGNIVLNEGEKPEELKSGEVIEVSWTEVHCQMVTHVGEKQQQEE